MDTRTGTALPTSPAHDLAARPHLQDLAEFVAASPSSYHAAEEVARRLERHGFLRVDESRPYPSGPGGRVLVRDGAVIAWIVPEAVVPASGSAEDDDAAHSAGARTTGRAAGGGEGAVVDPVPVFRILGAHTDSPGFKLKPRPMSTIDGWVQAGVEVYGGPLLNSWLDRELRFAGRLALDDGRQVLAASGPIGRIPQLAVHLDRAVNTEGLVLHKQKHLHPVVGALSTDGTLRDVLGVLAEDAGVQPEQIRGHDVMVADAQPAGLFGAAGEFFASGRLDNLSSVHAGLVAFERLVGGGGQAGGAGSVGAGEGGSGDAGVAGSGGGVPALTVADGVAGEASGAPVIPVLAAFDHEELGSASRSGAAGPLLEEVLGRVLGTLGVEGEARARSLSGSWLLSADAGHLVHPNYAERHDPTHHPQVNRGPLLKLNANQRYSTDAGGSAAFARWCGVAGVPFQEFVSNNDMPCGSTIGPISATRLGIRTVDVGIGLLSMHSAREMCGVDDPVHLTGAVEAFFSGV